MMAMLKWDYFADGENALYCTHRRGTVWQLDSGGQWARIPANFEQLSRFSPDLRDVTAEEARGLPANPDPAEPWRSSQAKA